MALSNTSRVSGVTDGSSRRVGASSVSLYSASVTIASFGLMRAKRRGKLRGRAFRHHEFRGRDVDPGESDAGRAPAEPRARAIAIR